MAKRERQVVEVEENIREAAVLETTAFKTRSLDASMSMAERINEVAKTYAKAQPEQRAGFLAEEYHAGTFNQDAALKGRPDLFARSGASCGRGTDLVSDIEILKRGQVVDSAQCKYCASTSKTTFEVSKPRYDGVQKVHPSDQGVKELAHRRRTSGIGQRNYPDTAQNATDRLHLENVESEPLRRDQALKLATDTDSAVKSMLRKEFTSAVVGGAALGAAVSATVSAAGQARGVIKGDKPLADAAGVVARDSIMGGLDGALKGATVVATKSILVRAGAATIGKTSAPVAIAVSVVDVGKDAIAAARGEITPKTLMGRTAKHGAQGVGGWAGMEAGTAVGTAVFPGVGTIVGGIVGGLAGHLAASLVSNAIGERLSQNHSNGPQGVIELSANSEPD